MGQQGPIEPQQNQQILKLDEQRPALHQKIEHRAHQHPNLDVLLMRLHQTIDHQTIDHHRLVLQIGLLLLNHDQRVHPDHQVHPDLVAQVVEAGVEEDKHIIVLFSHKIKRLFKMNSLFIF